jgi:hypothetical protein
LPPEAEGRRITSIMADVWNHSEQLLQQEMQLARRELEVRLDAGKLALRRAAIGAGLTHAAYLNGLAALVLASSEFLRPSLAAFVVAVVASLGAYLFSQRSEAAAAEITQPSQSTHRFDSGAGVPHQ